MTSIVKLQVTLFPDWSTAVYVITWVPWLNLWSGWWFDVSVGRIPELSVADGSVQFTSAENRPRSAYTTKRLDGQVAPNVGGRMSGKRTSSLLGTTLCRIIVSYSYKSYLRNYYFFYSNLYSAFGMLLGNDKSIFKGFWALPKKSGTSL